jgi:endonuclease/exonuclease/phosphatase family metal-dependent hydrolase
MPVNRFIGALAATTLAIACLLGAALNGPNDSPDLVLAAGAAAPAAPAQAGSSAATTAVKPGRTDGPLVAAPNGRTATSIPIPSSVRVATYNICKSTCGKGRYSWGKRRVALVRTVEDESPDVLALQEANTGRYKGSRQIDDVRRRMARIGYTIASTDYSCTRGCTRGAHIFYKSSTMHLAATKSVAPAGMRGMSSIAGARFGKVQDRAVSWAFLTPNGGPRATLYISVHLPTQQTGTGERLRRNVARHLTPWAKGLVRRSGLSGVQIVIAGDFNSFGRRQPNGAQKIVAQAGLIDSASAPVRINDSYGTVNYTPKTRKYGGFPPRPYKYGGTSPARIDYIFASVAAQRHEIVLKRTSSGRFNDAYRASDHNMVVVTLPLG